MIRHLLPVLVLLALTNPRGNAIFIDSASIAAVAPGDGHCETPLGKASHFTRIDVGTGSYCVRESVEDVAAKIRDADKEDAE